MAKINIAGVRKGDDNYTVHLILTEPQEIEGQIQEVPIGEAFIPFPTSMEIADMRDRIIDAAQEIWKAHKDAQDKRKDLEELVFPEIGITLP